MIAEHVATLRGEARRANERRVLVLSGNRDAGLALTQTALSAADIADTDVTVVSAREDFPFETVGPRSAGSLLGRTREAIVIDAHDYFAPNTLGQVVGAVDGGGLLILVVPPLDEWPDRRDEFDETLAVPPATIDDVTGRFRERFVDTLRAHDGISILSVRTDEDGSPPPVALEKSGTTDPADADPRAVQTAPPGSTFPDLAYESCLTRDQARTVRILERLQDPGTAIVVEADRGRGKSSAAGLAAGALAADGADVLVTAPTFRNAGQLFERAREFLSARNEIRTVRDDGTRIETGSGGVIHFESPTVAQDLVGDPDAVIVDEAAALPVSVLLSFLDARAVAFCTTVHGYEGAGRGFSVRFMDRLIESDRSVSEATLHEPIRYARDDPVEQWAFRALLMNARPAVEPAVKDVSLGDLSYRHLSPAELAADEHLLSEAFGLLVLAHYRTEPNDLARVLDAPNLTVRALVADDHVVSVALLAREGGLPESMRTAMYDGERVRGNMIPDVLTSQLRDPDAAISAGIRTVRIATHHAVRERRFGTKLLDRIHDEFDDVDWFGVGYGATARLLRFWRRAGYRTVHVSTTRHETSGEYSAIMLRPASSAGDDLHDRHATCFRDRIPDVLSDALRDLDPDVARGAIRACSAPPVVDLTDHEWRVVVGASYGPGMYDAAPGGFRQLALAHLLERSTSLSPDQERLLVRKVLQGHSWEDVADELGYVSTSECMRALGEAVVPLVEAYGEGELVAAERERYE